VSFVKRVVNLGRGLGRAWLQPDPAADPSVNEPRGSRRSSAQHEEDEEDYEPATERRIDLLDKMRAEGLLDDREYRTKRANVLGLAPPDTDSTDEPKRRKL